MDKIMFIQDFINKCDKILEVQDALQAKELGEIIVETFQNEIENIFYSYGYGSDYLGDIYKLKIKLLNYKYDLKRADEISRIELEKAKLQSAVSAVINNTNSMENITNISTNISISNQISDSIRLIESEKNLNQDEKQKIQEMLMELQTDLVKKDKKGSKEKIETIVATLMDKGTDTLISLLPSIGSIANLLGQI